MHLDPSLDQTRAPDRSPTSGPVHAQSEDRRRTIGGQRPVYPFAELWDVRGCWRTPSRSTAHWRSAPRWSRRASHWTRLLLVDRAVTNRERTAVLTLSDTPWVPAVRRRRRPPRSSPPVSPVGPAPAVRRRGGVGDPRSPGPPLRGDPSRAPAVAPGALLVGDFVAREAGSGDAMGRGDARQRRRRHAVRCAPTPFRQRPPRTRRVCVSTRRAFDSADVGTATAGGQRVSILLRD